MNVQGFSTAFGMMAAANKLWAFSVFIIVPVRQAQSNGDIQVYLGLLSFWKIG
jgi:hypothetical protein